MCGNKIVKTALLSTLIGGGLVTQGEPPGLAPSGRPDVELNHSFGGKSAPKWNHGYFLAYDWQPDSAPAVHVWISSGTKLFESPLAIDGVARVAPVSFAASAAGSFVVSGEAYGLSGAAVSFLAWFDNTGQIGRAHV